MTASYFDVFRTAPVRGRVFGPLEDQPGREQVVFLSHRYWTSQLGADPGIVGKTITLDGRPHDVVGVMPAAFDFTADTESMWVPIAFTPERRAQHDEHYLMVHGRLRAGVTMEQAGSELAAIGGRLARRFANQIAKTVVGVAADVRAGGPGSRSSRSSTCHSRRSTTSSGAGRAAISSSSPARTATPRRSLHPFAGPSRASIPVSRSSAR